MAPRKKPKAAAADSGTAQEPQFGVPKTFKWTPEQESAMLQLLYHRVQQMQKEPHGTFTTFAAKWRPAHEAFVSGPKRAETMFLQCVY